MTRRRHADVLAYHGVQAAAVISHGRVPAAEHDFIHTRAAKFHKRGACVCRSDLVEDALGYVVHANRFTACKRLIDGCR